ncbi:glutathione S-transferase-like [Onthophagus taurus]|uniref:glutathione S-transferase-like n=1 Tax=Onthophagus taurus TaxID=166361 RepID=UPI0039BDB9F1
MSSTKVSYFNGKGLAETIRILLKYGKVDFEDIRFEKENWPEIKPTVPFGQVPIYEEDGKKINQSVAISRYLAKKFGLTGSNEWEDLELDAIVDTITDFRMKAVPIYMESDPDKKEVIKQDFLVETVPYYLEKFDKIAGENGGFMAIKKFTWADIVMLTVTDLVSVLVGQDITEKYQNIQNVKKYVKEIPAIKEWIETRPETEF